MKHFTFKGKHYIWRPSVLALNILKGIMIGSIAGFYAWAMLVFTTGGPLW